MSGKLLNSQTPFWASKSSSKALGKIFDRRGVRQGSCSKIIRGPVAVKHGISHFVAWNVPIQRGIRRRRLKTVSHILH